MIYKKIQIVNTPGRILARAVIVPMFFLIVGPVVGLLLFFLLGAIAKGGVPTQISAPGMLVGIAVIIFTMNMSRKIGSDRKPEVLNTKAVSTLITGLILVIILSFLAFFVIAVGSILIAPILAYGIGGGPALVAGIVFSLMVCFKAPLQINFLVSALIGAALTMNSIFNAGILKGDQWAVVAVGAASAVLTGQLVLASGLHIPGTPTSKKSRSELSSVEEPTS